MVWMTRVLFPAGAMRGFFSLHHCIQTSSGDHQASYPWGMGWLFPPGVKQPGHEVDHSLPSSTKVKNAYSCTSTSLYVFMVWYLVEYSDNFTFKLNFLLI
jgi:hypothetical protein